MVDRRGWNSSEEEEFDGAGVNYEDSEGEGEGELACDGETPAEATPEELRLTLQAKLDETEKQAKEYYEHLQRLQAEFDNFRKRTQKEKEETVKYAAERVIEAMLPILDNFNRAMLASENHQDFAGLVQGMELILRQMQSVLAKEGLKEIEALGQPFDPNLHEAVLQIDSKEHPENTVVEELQKGYYLKEKVLRPSMVKVSR